MLYHGILGAEVISMDITFPIASEDDLLIRLEQTLQKHPNIKLAITGRSMDYLSQNNYNHS